MACPMIAWVQNPLTKQILHDPVFTPDAAPDAEEHDLLALGSGGWYPIDQVIEYCFVACTVDVESDPQHVVVRVSGCGLQERLRVVEVDAAVTSVSVTL